MSFLKFDGEVLGGPFPADNSPEMPVPIHRAKLQRALYDYVVSLGISVTFDNHVSRFFEAQDKTKAGVITNVGERFEADLVVAADGVGSKSWKLIQGSQSEARSSGFAVYRTAFPTEVAHREPVVAEKFPVLQNGNDDVRMYLGPDAHAITLISRDITTWSLTHKVSLLLRAHSSSQASRENPFPPMLILDKGHRNIRRIVVQANVRRFSFPRGLIVWYQVGPSPARSDQANARQERG